MDVPTLLSSIPTQLAVLYYMDKHCCSTVSAVGHGRGEGSFIVCWRELYQSAGNTGWQIVTIVKLHTLLHHHHKNGIIILTNVCRMTQLQDQHLHAQAWMCGAIMKHLPLNVHLIHDRMHSVGRHQSVCVQCTVLYCMPPQCKNTEICIMNRDDIVTGKCATRTFEVLTFN